MYNLSTYALILSSVVNTENYSWWGLFEAYHIVKDKCHPLLIIESHFFSIYKMQRLNCSLQSILVLTFYKSVNQLTKYRAGDICRCSWLKAFLAKSYSYSEPTVHMLMKYNQLYIFCVAGKKQQRRWFKNHLLLASEYLYIEIYSF